MADVDGSGMIDAAGGDSSNGPAELADDGHGCARRGPFLIGVAGGTASGKVWSPVAMGLTEVTTDHT